VNPPKPRRPVCPAILLCHRATGYPDTGQWDLFGVFNGLGIPAMPVQLSLVVVLSITDGQGDYELELSVEHDESESTLGRATNRISLRSPIVVHEEAVPLGLSISQYGTYAVKLKANGDLVGQRTFTILPDRPPQ
jgi:hypothetical protein